MKYLILAGLFVLGASCSNSDKPGIFESGTAGSSGSHAGSGGHAPIAGKGGAAVGAEGGEAGIGQGGAGSMVSPLAPRLSITNPSAASDANADAVLIGDQVTVVCSVHDSDVAGAKPVNPSSVKIAMLDATGASIKSVAGSPTEKPNEYSAPFVLTALPSGRVSFQCSADDTASPPNRALVTLDTLLDQGPTITAVEPVKDSAHNVLGPVNIEFTVAAAPITEDDSQADVSGVTLLVAGVTIAPMSKGGGHYQASVDFSDKALFPSPPTGTTTIVIGATNKRRSPMKTTHTLTYTFVLDGAGPVVTFASPGEGAVIGRASMLSFSIADTGAGVDPTTVEVKLDANSFMFSTTNGLWTLDSNGNYTFKIGTQLGSDSSAVQLTVNVNARDKAGNASNGNSRGFKLDTQPPFVDLDPPNMFYLRATSPQKYQCSDLFDPIGSDAPNDLSVVTNLGWFRALVWDQANYKAGLGIRTYALADKSSVRLYVQPDTTKPLLHDETGPMGVPDGTCDEIWTGSAPEQKNPDDKPLQFVALTALTATGSADFGVSLTPPTDAICDTGPISPQAKLCNNTSDLSVIIHHAVVVNPHEPVVYAYQPVANAPQDPKCAGDQWDLSGAIHAAGVTKLGWVCVAARALDTVGNPGVSAPLRLCLDDGTNIHRCDGVPPPSCLDNCTMPTPAHFQVPIDSQL